MSYEKQSEEHETRRSSLGSEPEDLHHRKSGMIVSMLTGVEDDPEFVLLYSMLTI